MTHEPFHQYVFKRPILHCSARVYIIFFHHKWYVGHPFQNKNPFVLRREILFHSRRTSFHTRHSTVRLLPVSVLSSSVFIFFLAASTPMASPSAYSSNSEDQEVEIPKVSRLAKGKRKSTEQSQSSKDVRHSTKKHKFQSSMEQTDKYPVTKLLLPRYIDFEDPQFCQVCSRLLDIFKF